MPDTNNSKLKPAQVLLSEKDRRMMDRLAQRLAGQRRLPGPTALFRAGLGALTELPDEALFAALDEVDERPTLAQLEARFTDWCGRVARRVAQSEPALAYAWEGSRQTEQRGFFTNQGRFVLVSMMEDGRLMISGMAAVTEPVPYGGKIPRAPVLFPGGLATLLAMNEAGEALGARAITAWLMPNEDEITAVRDAIRTHDAEVLR